MARMNGHISVYCNVEDNPTTPFVFMSRSNNNSDVYFVSIGPDELTPFVTMQMTEAQLRAFLRTCDNEFDSMMDSFEMEGRFHD